MSHSQEMKKKLECRTALTGIERTSVVASRRLRQARHIYTLYGGGWLLDLEQLAGSRGGGPMELWTRQAATTIIPCGKFLPLVFLLTPPPPSLFCSAHPSPHTPPSFFCNLKRLYSPPAPASFSPRPTFPLPNPGVSQSQPSHIRATLYFCMMSPTPPPAREPFFVIDLLLFRSLPLSPPFPFRPLSFPPLFPRSPVLGSFPSFSPPPPFFPAPHSPYYFRQCKASSTLPLPSPCTHQVFERHR